MGKWEELWEGKRGRVIGRKIGEKGRVMDGEKNGELWVGKGGGVGKKGEGYEWGKWGWLWVGKRVGL